ncbi:MAG: MmcQ/YjbR family DNA-binding protein [Myxococcota bacterium]
MSPKARPAPPSMFEQLRVVCYALPGVEEKLSYGAPAFHVRGKQFVIFSDARDHAPGALVKLSLERQAEKVAEDAARFSVPAYFGVKGWTSVRLDAGTDWEELAILVEEAWSSVAPANTAALGPVRPPPPPPALPTTDPALARAALEKVKALMARYPGTTCEEENGHATFKSDKVVAYFLDNHHGDGAIGLVVKVSAPGEQDALAARDPERYYRPAYLAARGWVGVRLEPGRVDWRDVEARLAASFANVAKPAKASAAKPAKAAAAKPAKAAAAQAKAPARKPRG